MRGRSRLETRLNEVLAEFVCQDGPEALAEQTQRNQEGAQVESFDIARRGQVNSEHVPPTPNVDMNAREKEQLWREFDAAWERGIETRCRYSFIKTHKPVIDDLPFRAWKSTADYRRWCDENVPTWLGYGSN